MNGLEAVLAAHAWTGRGCWCNCWPTAEMLGSDRLRWRYPSVDEHAAHLAAKVREHLLSEKVVERAGEAVEDELQDPHSGRRDIALAALTEATS